MRTVSGEIPSVRALDFDECPLSSSWQIACSRSVSTSAPNSLIAPALRAVAAGEAEGEGQVRRVLEAGRAGQALIPGKHGAATTDFREITVQIADKPGELGRLFSAVGVAQVNLEDLRIEHVLGRPSGLVALYVQPAAADRLVEALQALSFDVRS